MTFLLNTLPVPMWWDSSLTWLSKWNCKVARENRKVLLLVDNAPYHVVDAYSNITIQFLPPNTTAKIQPMDQGCVKMGYRSMLSDLYFEGISNNEEAKAVMKQFDIKVACDIVVTAWKNVKQSTTQNCFAKAGFIHFAWVLNCSVKFFIFHAYNSRMLISHFALSFHEALFMKPLLGYLETRLVQKKKKKCLVKKFKVSGQDSDEGHYTK